MTTDFVTRFNECTSGISHISSGSALERCSECSRHLDYEDGVAYTEPYFSWSHCDTCDSTLGGNREDGHGFYDDTLIHLAMCSDCVAFVANGTLPESEDD